MTEVPSVVSGGEDADEGNGANLSPQPDLAEELFDWAKQTGRYSVRGALKRKAPSTTDRPAQPNSSGVALPEMPNEFWWVDLNDGEIARSLIESLGRNPTQDEIDAQRAAWYSARPTVRPNLLPRWGDEMLGRDF